MMNEDVKCLNPSFDSIESEPEAIMSLVALSIQSALLVLVLVYLIKFLRKTFSYKKNGLYEAIQLLVISLMSLLMLILTRVFCLQAYNLQGNSILPSPEDENAIRIQQHLNSNKIFGNLLASMTVLFVNDTYLFLSVIWLRFAYEVDKMRKYKWLRLGIKIGGPWVVNLSTAIIISFIHTFKPPSGADRQKINDTWYINFSTGLLLVSTILTEVVFSYASYKIFMKSRQNSFKEYSDSALQKLRIGVVAIYILSLVRIAFFVVQTFSDPVKLRGFDQTKCKDTGAVWAIVILLQSVLFTAPPVILLVVFLRDRFKRVKNTYRSNLMQSAFLEW